MTEEEKKAIDIVENIKFKQYAIYNAKEMKNEIRFYQTEEERKAIDIVLGLIDKQQKEIEELKKDNENQWKHRCKMAIELDNNVISKDKIRNLLKQVNASLYHFKDSEKNNIMQRIKDRLEQLLEE